MKARFTILFLAFSCSHIPHDLTEPAATPKALHYTQPDQVEETYIGKGGPQSSHRSIDPSGKLILNGSPYFERCFVHVDKVEGKIVRVGFNDYSFSSFNWDSTDFYGDYRRRLVSKDGPNGNALYSIQEEWVDELRIKARNRRRLRLRCEFCDSVELPALLQGQTARFISDYDDEKWRQFDVTRSCGDLRLLAPAETIEWKVPAVVEGPQGDVLLTIWPIENSAWWGDFTITSLDWSMTYRFDVRVEEKSGKAWKEIETLSWERRMNRSQKASRVAFQKEEFRPSDFKTKFKAGHSYRFMVALNSKAVGFRHLHPEWTKSTPVKIEFKR